MDCHSLSVHKSFPQHCYLFHEKQYKILKRSGKIRKIKIFNILLRVENLTKTTLTLYFLRYPCQARKVIGLFLRFFFIRFWTCSHILLTAMHGLCNTAHTQTHTRTNKAKTVANKNKQTEK